MKYILPFLFVASLITAQEVGYKLELQSGIVYRNWAESDNSTLCRIAVTTPNTAATTANPALVILLFDYIPSRELDAIIGGFQNGLGILGPLRDGDYFGAVSFAKEGREVYPLQVLSKSNRSIAVNAIKTFRSQEGRNLQSGLLAVEQQLKNTGSVSVSGRYLFLVTSGNSDSSTSQKDLDKIRELTENYNIKMHTIGYDLFYSESFMLAAADISGGRAFFVEKDNIDALQSIITKESRNCTTVGPQNVSFSLTLPKGTTISDVFGARCVDNDFNLGNLLPGTTNSIYFLLNQRPQKRRDPAIELTYTDPDDISDFTDQHYLELPLAKERGGYKIDQAPRLLEYGVWKILDELADGIYEHGKKHRLYIMETIDKRILELEDINVSINADYLKTVILKLKTLREALRNPALEDSHAVKLIHYGYSELVHPESVE